MMGGKCSILFCGLADLIALIFLSSSPLVYKFYYQCPYKTKNKREILPFYHLNDIYWFARTKLWSSVLLNNRR